MSVIRKALFAVAVLSLVLFPALLPASAETGGADPKVDALFLGTKGENGPLLDDLLNRMVAEHLDWRRSFHPEDPPPVPAGVLDSPEAAETARKLREVLLELSARLKQGSNPWFSPRYLGHMNADLLLPGIAGYLAAMLYNPNNVVYEGGPATTEIEMEVAAQLAGLIGYDPARAWGNITAGGSTANFQALWYARNLKSLPLAVKAVLPELVRGRSERELLNLPVGEVLDLLDRVKASPKYEEVLRRTVKGAGVDPEKLGRLLVPQSRHYSWDKAADLFGIGSGNIVAVPVDRHYRLDVSALDRILAGLAEKGIPVLAVVSVLGSTEEGAVDETHRVAALRDKYAGRGLGFYYHVDAAYGGYVRSMFLDPSGAFMSLEEVRRTALERYGIPGSAEWPVKSVYDAFKALPEADSVTIDAHKLGYVPYPAGALVFRDRRILAVQTFHAAYVQDLRAKAPVSIGEYTLEGSKPGASAAAVWVAHRVLPLHAGGYGRLLGRTVKTANMLHDAMNGDAGFESKSGRRYRFIPLVKPDLNIVDYVVREVGNPSLAAMNRLNGAVYRECSYVSGDLMHREFVISKTVFAPAEYGRTPLDFVRKCGFEDSEWERTPSVMILRSTVMTPYLSDEAVFRTYYEMLRETVKEIVSATEG